jgi:hypothetical protein
VFENDLANRCQTEAIAVGARREKRFEDLLENGSVHTASRLGYGNDGVTARHELHTDLGRPPDSHARHAANSAVSLDTRWVARELQSRQALHESRKPFLQLGFGERLAETAMRAGAKYQMSARMIRAADIEAIGLRIQRRVTHGR